MRQEEGKCVGKFVISVILKKIIIKKMFVCLFCFVLVRLSAERVFAEPILLFRINCLVTRPFRKNMAAIIRSIEGFTSEFYAFGDVI